MNGHIISDNPTRHPDLVVPRVYLRDLHAAQDPAMATSFGITHVLSILDFRPTFPREMDYIKRMHVNLSDNFRENITPHLDDTDIDLVKVFRICFFIGDNGQPILPRNTKNRSAGTCS